MGEESHLHGGTSYVYSTILVVSAYALTIHDFGVGGMQHHYPASALAILNWHSDTSPSDTEKFHLMKIVLMLSRTML